MIKSDDHTYIAGRALGYKRFPQRKSKNVDKWALVAHLLQSRRATEQETNGHNLCLF